MSPFANFHKRILGHIFECRKKFRLKTGRQKKCIHTISFSNINWKIIKFWFKKKLKIVQNYEEIIIHTEKNPKFCPAFGFKSTVYKNFSYMYFPLTTFGMLIVLGILFLPAGPILPRVEVSFNCSCKIIFYINEIDNFKYFWKSLFRTFYSVQQNLC